MTYPRIKRETFPLLEGHYVIPVRLPDRHILALDVLAPQPILHVAERSDEREIFQLRN